MVSIKSKILIVFLFSIITFQFDVLAVTKTPAKDITVTGMTGNCNGSTNVQSCLDEFDDFSGGGDGTVTSVAISGSDGIEIDSGSPITESGTIALGVNKVNLLAHINVEDGADVTDASNVSSAGAVMKSEYTPAHSILVQQSGVGSPTALQISNDTLVGRLSGVGSEIEDLSVSDVKTLLSISNVDNTSDLNKPISTATQTALDLKVDENTSIVGATKTKITYDTKGLVTSGDDATTADISDSVNKRYVTDAQKTVIENTSGVNTGDQTNITGNSGTVTTNANLTGVVTSVGNATSIADSALSIAKTSGLQTAIDGKANTSGALTQFIGNGNYKVFYSDGSGDVIELAFGDSGKVLQSNGATSAPTWGSVSVTSFQQIETTASSSASLWSTVGGADVSVTSGKKYFIQYRMRTYSEATTTGIGLRRSLVTATGTVHGWQARGHVNNATQSGGSSREGTDDDYISAGNTTNTTSRSGFFSVDTLFECTSSGTFRLEMNSEIEGSLATIDGDGSYLIITEF